MFSLYHIKQGEHSRVGKVKLLKIKTLCFNINLSICLIKQHAFKAWEGRKWSWSLTCCRFYLCERNLRDIFDALHKTLCCIQSWSERGGEDWTPSCFGNVKSVVRPTLYEISHLIKGFANYFDLWYLNNSLNHQHLIAFRHFVKMRKETVSFLMYVRLSA